MSAKQFVQQFFGPFIDINGTKSDSKPPMIFLTYKINKFNEIDKGFANENRVPLIEAIEQWQNLLAFQNVEANALSRKPGGRRVKDKTPFWTNDAMVYRSANGNPYV